MGFTLIALGLSSATVSIAYGKVVKSIPRFIIVLLGAAINVILLVFLFVWERVPSYEVIFAFAIGWGVADAVWHNVSCSRLLYMHKNKNAYILLVASFQTQSFPPPPLQLLLHAIHSWGGAWEQRQYIILQQASLQC